MPGTDGSERRVRTVAVHSHRDRRRTALDKQRLTKVFDAVEKRGDELVQLLAEIIRVPSVVGEEGPAQELVASWFRDDGLKTDVWEPDIKRLREHPAFFETLSYQQYGYDGRPNVIGTLSGAGGGNSMIIYPHIDVVSAAPEDEWTYDPWAAEIHDGRLYGRGAVDMKPGLVCSLVALRALRDAGITLAGDVQIQSIIEEEAGGVGGALATLVHGYRADGALCPHPGDRGLATLNVASAGVLWFRVTVLGKPSHGGRAHEGVNAVEKLIPIFEALNELGRKRHETVEFDLFKRTGTGHSTSFCIGTVHAGDWPSTVPGLATMECRIGFIPGESMADIKQLVQTTVQDVASTDDWLKDNPPEITWFGWQAEPSVTEPNHPLIQSAGRAVSHTTGRDPSVVGVPVGQDARYYRMEGIPAVSFGPTGGGGHGKDEYCQIDSLVPFTKALTLFLMDWCGVASG